MTFATVVGYIAIGFLLAVLDRANYPDGSYRGTTRTVILCFFWPFFLVALVAAFVADQIDNLVWTIAYEIRMARDARKKKVSK